MDRFFRVALCALCAVLCACDIAAPIAPSNRAPASLPADILRGLNTDEAVLDCFAGAPGAQVVLQDDWFSSRQFDLDGDGRSDWLVDAVNACLRGANGVTWVYLARGDSHRLAARITATVAVAPGKDSPASELVETTGTRAGRHRYTADNFVLDAAPLAATFIGEWQPLSKAYADLGSLHVRARSMDLGSCADHSFDVLNADADQVRLVLASIPPCRAAGDTAAVVDLALGAKPCQLEVTLYASTEAAQNAALYAWGVFERPTCP